MDQRASQNNLEEKQQEPEFINWKNNFKFMNKKNMIANHKRHLTEPKVAMISIPKSIYNTYQSNSKKKTSINKRSEKRKKSIPQEELNILKTNKSKEKIDIGLCYNTNRLKWTSKKKSAKIFSTKDSQELPNHTDSKSTLRGTFREVEDRRSTSSIGFYNTDRKQQSRYIGVGGSNTSLKAKGNSSMIQRQLKSRIIKGIWVSQNQK